MQNNLVYTKLDGRRLSLNLTLEEERAFFGRCYQAYLKGHSTEDFTRLANLVTGDHNPLLKPTDGRITPVVWMHPLFQAVRDLEDRLGIRTGDLKAAPGDGNAQDPTGDDQTILIEDAPRVRS
jgi:hypothetical protein